jgi:S-formylglutathione hydrolase FrmB
MIGKQDNPRDIADEQRFVAAAKSLGMDVEFITFDGRHDFDFWKEAFQKWLPWALSRMGSPK